MNRRQRLALGLTARRSRAYDGPRDPNRRRHTTPEFGPPPERAWALVALDAIAERFAQSLLFRRA